MDYTKILSQDNSKLHNIIFCRHKDKLSTNLDQEAVILDMASGVYSQLNTVGSTIWDILEHPATFKEILEEVMSTYDTTERECTDEILNFLRDLVDNQLIQLDNDSVK